jgi:hypothetical protein
MSLLSDIYISSDEEAVKYDPAPATFAERAQYKGVSPLELSTLWAIMQGIKWDVASMDEFKCLFVIEGGERLVHSFPPTMLTALCQLTPDQIREISGKWAETDELACAGADIRDIQPVVEDMARLARLAAPSGRGLYLWNCV